MRFSGIAFQKFCTWLWKICELGFEENRIKKSDLPLKDPCQRDSSGLVKSCSGESSIGRFLATNPGSAFNVAGELRNKMWYIINIMDTFVENKQQKFMNRKKQVVFPKYQEILEQVGENIKLARKRRKLTTLQVAERAGIDRSTLYHIEKGKSSVSMAAYFNALLVLGLQNDFLKLAADDDYGRKLQDLNLIGKK